MSFNSSIGYMGVGIQKDRATDLTAAKFKFLVYDDSGIKPDRVHSDSQLSSASRNQSDPSLDAVKLPVDIETRAYVGSLVMFTEAVMGSRSTAGAGDPYTHTISTGTLPYLTVFESLGASDASLQSLAKVKVDQLSLSWEGPGALWLKVSGKGCTYDATAADWDGTATDETDGDGYFYPVGGTFTWDAVGTTAAAFTCAGGDITFANNLVEIPNCASITPHDHAEGKLAVAFSLKMAPDSLSDFIEIQTGATDGSSPTSDVQYGKVALVFQEAGAGTHTLTITASRVVWTVPPVTISPGTTLESIDVTGIAYYNSTESDALDLAITNALAGTVYDKPA